MDNFTDYYAVLGVEADTPPDEIKAAFKKLALQYHPDVYKGADAHERMRVLLLAYQTLNDPVARRQYDAQHHYDGHASYGANKAGTTVRSAVGKRARTEVSPGARRDRQRHYSFPDMLAGRSIHIDLVDIDYTLSAAEAHTLVQEGLLRGIRVEGRGYDYYCHRCHHSWDMTELAKSAGKRDVPRFCPHCQATDWAEYLLLRCIHCCAVFESEQIRYAIGAYTYGKDRPNSLGGLCPPYELFPLCPYCATARWCPAEDLRVSELRQRAARHAARWRLALISVVMFVILVVGAMALGIIR